MQVLCVRTTEPAGDAECPICHNHYHVYYSRKDQAECTEALEQVMAALRADHKSKNGADAHTSEVFNVPAWNGPAHASGAALLSGVRLPRPNGPQAVLEATPTAWRRVC